MRKTKQLAPKGKKKFAIIVDGETEFWYFQMIKRNNKVLPVDLKPEIPQKKKLYDQYLKVLDYSDIYDKAIWIVDLDAIHEETRNAKKGDKTALQAYKEYYDELSKKDNVLVIVNNPCLEYWLLLHFESTSRFFDDCDKAGKKLKTHVPAYEKTEKFYTAQNQDIYLKLKPRMKIAIENAAKLKHFSFENTQTGISEMNKLFELEEMKMVWQ